MAKYRIINQGSAFYDDYAANSTDVAGVRINGSCVERLGKNGQWFTAYNAGEPIDNLLWTENGAVQAVTSSGKVAYSNVNLTCNPKNKPSVREITIGGKKSSSRGKREEYSDSSSGAPAILLWPLKGLWWLVKFIFWTLLFDSIMSSNNKKR